MTKAELVDVVAEIGRLVRCSAKLYPGEKVEFYLGRGPKGTISTNIPSTAAKTFYLIGLRMESLDGTSKYIVLREAAVTIENIY